MKRSISRKNVNSAWIIPSALKTGLLAVTLLVAAPAAEVRAQDTNAPAQPGAAAAKPDKGPPLPLHEIEGNGGVFATLSAYLVNPPCNGEWLGRPSVGFAFVDLGHERNLEAFTITETPWKRLELGYAFDRLDIGDLPQAIEQATSIRIRDDEVHLHNVNARLQLLAENEYGQPWLPAVTVGAHYKYNETVNRINDDLSGALRANGIRDNQGVDFTLYGSKLLTFLPRPVLVELGGRATKASHLGLLGFTDDYNFLFEGNVVLFVTDSILLAGEYRQKPNDFKPIPGLIRPEDDWWTIDAAYVVNKHLTLAAGYGHFGGVLNHQADGVWGLTLKYEF